MIRVVTAFGALLALAGASSGAPVERPVVSLAAAAGLSQRALFDITFETGQDGRLNHVWIASSNGLYSYDGYRWRRFGAKEGLPSDTVRCVLSARDGNLWVGTDKGAGIFDGTSFRTEGSEKGLAGPSVRRITQDKDGGLWFASDNGGIARLKQKHWQAWRARDGLPSEAVVNQFTDSAGRPFVITRKGPARLAGDRWVAEQTPALPPGASWDSGTMNELPGFGLLLSNGAQVLLSGGTYWWAMGTPPSHRHGMAVTRQGRVVIAGETSAARRAFFEWNGWMWNRISDDFAVPNGSGEQLREAPDGSLWYLGFDCLIRWGRDGAEWSSLPAAPGPMFTDSMGGVWAFSDQAAFPNYRQLAQLGGNQWLYRGLYQNYAVDRQGGVWALADGRVTLWKGGANRQWGAGDTGIASILSAAVDGSGVLWLMGRDGSGSAAIATYNGRQWDKRAAPELGKPAAASAAASKQGIWLLLTGGGQARLALAGARVQVFPIPADALSKSGGDIRTDPEGNVWLFGEAGLHRFGADRQWKRVDDLPARHVRSLSFQGNALWALLDASSGGRSGLLRITPASREFFEAELTSRFSQSPDGTLAAGARGRMYVISADAGAPVEIRLPSEEQVTSAVREPGGRLLAATARVTAQFNPDGVPPDTDLVPASGGVLYGEAVVLSAVARERFRKPGPDDQFSYSWQLDGGPWTPFANSNTLRLEPYRLAVGNHHVSVRARDSGLDIDPSPAETAFRVYAMPLQERGWFRALVGIGLLLLALTSAAAIIARRKAAAQAEELERRVEARTASLVSEIVRRGRTEADLRNSDRRFREIVEAAPEGIASFDAEGRCTLANREFARMIDRPLDQIVGRKPEEFLSADVLTHFRSELDPRKAANPPQAAELTLRHSSGRPCHLILRGRPRLDASGKPESTLLTTIDVTAGKEAELALRRSEAHYRELFESNPHPMLLVDLDTFRFLAVNQAACGAHGYSREEFQKLSILDLQLARNVPAARSKLDERLTGTACWSWTHRRKDGTALQVEITARDLDFQGRRARLLIAAEAAERKPVIAASREGEARPPRSASAGG